MDEDTFNRVGGNVGTTIFIPTVDLGKTADQIQ